MNFHLPRSALVLPQLGAGAALLAERANEIALAPDVLAESIPALDAKLAGRLRDLAASLADTAASGQQGRSRHVFTYFYLRQSSAGLRLPALGKRGGAVPPAPAVTPCGRLTCPACHRY